MSLGRQESDSVGTGMTSRMDVHRTRKLAFTNIAPLPLRHGLAHTSVSRASRAHAFKGTGTPSMTLKDNVRVGAAALALAATVATTPMSALAAFPDSPPSTLFYDAAGVVQKSSAGLAEKALAGIQTRDSYTVRFVVVKSLPYNSTLDEYAKDLHQTWGCGPSDVVIVGGTKVARAGVYVGDEAAKRLTPQIAESLGNETYAVKAGVESYSSAVLDVSNRLIPVMDGEMDPGAPGIAVRESVQTYKTKGETSAQRGKYIKVVGAVLIISFVAPIIQTLWYTIK